MLNKEGLNKKPNTQEEAPTNIIKDFPKGNQEVNSAEHRGIREQLEHYSDVRMLSGRISETHSRQTYFIDDEVNNKLENLIEYFEATNGLQSKFKEHQTLKQTREARLLAKGINSKIVNYAIETILDQWEQQEGLIVDMERLRYKVQDGTHHRTFKFTENGTTYLMTQNNRGVELEYMDSETYPMEDIQQRFDYYKSLAEQSK